MIFIKAITHPYTDTLFPNQASHADFFVLFLAFNVFVGYTRLFENV